MKARSYPESKIQSAFFEWISVKYPNYFPLCFSIPNEGKRTLQAALAMKKNGLKTGIPDVFCAIPNGSHHGLFIEFKTKTGRITADQRASLANFLDAGYECRVCRSIEEAIKEFDSYTKHGRSLTKQDDNILQNCY